MDTQLSTNESYFELGDHDYNLFIQLYKEESLFLKKLEYIQLLWGKNLEHYAPTLMDDQLGDQKSILTLLDSVEPCHNMGKDEQLFASVKRDIMMIKNTYGGRCLTEYLLSAHMRLMTHIDLVLAKQADIKHLNTILRIEGIHQKYALIFQTLIEERKNIID